MHIGVDGKMMKKYFMILGIVMLCSLVVAIGGRKMVRGIPLATEQSPKECSDMKMYFAKEYLMNDADSIRDWEIAELYKDDEYIAVVKVEKVQIAAAHSINRLKVLKNIKGNAKTNQKNNIHLVTENSLIYTARQGGSYQNDQMFNCLREGDIYMVAFNPFNSESFRKNMKEKGLDFDNTYVADLGWYGKLCLQEQKDIVCIDPAKMYTYKELLHTDFFSGSNEAQNAWQTMRKQILQKYLGKDYRTKYVG